MKRSYFFFSVVLFSVCTGSSCLGEDSDIHKRCGEDFQNSINLCKKKNDENSELERKLNQANVEIQMLKFKENNNQNNQDKKENNNQNNQDKVEGLLEYNFTEFEQFINQSEKEFNKSSESICFYSRYSYIVKLINLMSVLCGSYCFDITNQYKYKNRFLDNINKLKNLINGFLLLVRQPDMQSYTMQSFESPKIKGKRLALTTTMVDKFIKQVEDSLVMINDKIYDNVSRFKDDTTCLYYSYSQISPFVWCVNKTN